MSYTCGDHARTLTEFLGFTCEGADPVATLRSPLSLEHWTMPLLEVLIIAGAVFALVHAWRRWRRDGDAINLGLWFGALVYLAVIEPPLYFPEWFGAEGFVGFIFAHNVFSVQLMFDRLPLYIVAFYPVIATLTYELVRALGVFARRGPALGALATAFASQVFYETFDQLGPQLRWWAWNPENTVNQPMFTSVPMNSMWVFASVSFGVLVYLVVVMLGPPRRAARGVRAGTTFDDGPVAPRRGGLGVTWRTIVAGVLTPVLMVVLASPTRVSVDAGGDPTLQRAIVWVFLGALWLVGLWLLVDGTRRTWNGSTTPIASPTFVRIYPATHLLVHVIFWITALPALFAATDGVTADGAPVGSLWYAAACIAVSAWFVVAATRATKPAPAPVAEPAPAVP